MQLSSLTAGDVICADGGFTCIRQGTHLVEDDNGSLFVRCNDGKHYLAGQAGTDGELIGFSGQQPQRSATQKALAVLGNGEWQNPEDLDALLEAAGVEIVEKRAALSRG